MNTDYWQEQLERCPAMRPWLERAARHAVKHGALPATLTLGDIPQEKTVRQALERIFHRCREEQGRLKVRLDAPLREKELWLPLADLLGLSPEPDGSRALDELLALTVRRLKVLHPEEVGFIEGMCRSDHLRRFLKSGPSAADAFMTLFEVLVSLRSTAVGITLSELGAKFFNDSKALRSGSLRQQLEHLLRLQEAGGNGDDATALFNACGIIENPYTTHAVVYAPFSYRTAEGEWLDWPCRLWLRGEAAILSWRTIRTIHSISLSAPCTILISSENAAPFHRLVEMRRAAFYTEGYPNAAVKTLLRHFARTGLACLHWGDTDYDGYRIADQIAAQIPSRMYVPPVGDKRLLERRLPFSPEQRQRAEQFLLANPAFLYGEELRQSLLRGWIEQEQTIDLFS